MISSRRNWNSSTAVMLNAALLLGALSATFSPHAFAQDAASPDAAQTALANAEVVHAQVRVASIDPATNTVTVRSARGSLADVDVNPALADVRRLRVGDRLNVAYQQALLVHIDKLATRGVR